jgi:hypothetical protein
MRRMKAFCLTACAGSLLLAVVAAQEAPKPPELTPEQKLTFQSALTEVYKQVAIGNNLRVLLLQNQQAQQAATAAMHGACPGEVVGLDKDVAECKPKPEVKTKEGSK